MNDVGKEKRPSKATMRKLAKALSNGRPFIATAKALAEAEGMDVNTLRRRAFEAGLRKPLGRSTVAQRFIEIVEARGHTLLEQPLLPDLRCRVRCSCGCEWAPFPQNVVYRKTGCPACAREAASISRRQTWLDKRM